MDQYECQDILAEVWAQLPRDVQQRVTLTIRCNDDGEPRTAVVTRLDGSRSWQLTLLLSDQLAETDVLLLCAEV